MTRPATTGLFALAILVPVVSGRAAEPVTPPPMYPPDTWEGRAAAEVRVLDKLDAHVETLTIPAGQDGSYKSLTIAVRSCLQHPPGLPPDQAAYLTVQDQHAQAKPFEGWMFSAEPFVAVYESPVFGVQLIACGGVDVAPAAPPLLPPPSSLPATADPNAPDANPSGAGPNAVYPSGAPDPSTVPPPVPPDGSAPPAN